ncbi:MAG: PAS domain-containing protein [Minwuia sp.]|uniref:PAS domain-containing protein n=1 Tax=Minwuia sp. TaxID=2493630 RepID=UPI003A8593DD
MPIDAAAEFRIIVADSIPESADPRIFRFLDAWRGARHGRLLPRKRDFEPLDVADLLGCVWLYRYDGEAGDFICRLAGEAVNDAWGGSIRGLTLRRIVGEADYPVMIGRWRRIVSTPLIHYGADSERLSGLSARRAERLLMPMTDDEGEAVFMLGLSLYRIESADATRPVLTPEDMIQVPCERI